MNSIYNKLSQLQTQAYCVYSKYPVACIVIDDKDQEFYGVNVENSSYGLSICAERNAIAHMVSCGSRTIKAIHILCGPNDEYEFASACGACRQVISEFIMPTGLIYLWNHHQTYKTYKIDEYLLDYFSKSYLKGEKHE